MTSSFLIVEGVGHLLGSLPIVGSKWFWLSLAVGIPLFVAWFVSDE